MRRSLLASALVAAVLAVASCMEADAAPVTGTLTVSPTTASGTTDVTVTWNITGAASCAAAGGWTGSKAPSGTEVVKAVSKNTDFTLNCVSPTGPATLNWTYSNKWTDGTTLTTITGAHIMFGSSASSLVSGPVSTAAQTSLTIEVPPGPTVFAFRVVATDASNVTKESDNSNTVSRTVTATSAAFTKSVTISAQPLPGVLNDVIVAFEIRPDGTGALAAFQIGLVPANAICGPDVQTIAGTVYHKVDIRLVDYTSVPTKLKAAEAWAKCPNA